MRRANEEITAALVRVPLDPAALSGIAMRLENPVDWNDVLRIAAAWDVEPVVLSNLRTHFAAAMPPGILSRVESREREARAWALARTLMVTELTQALEAAGIPVIVIKGPAVSLMAYGDASLRSFGDVDLLVRPREMLAAREFLFRRGFERTYDVAAESELIRHGHALELADGKNKVELHDRLFPRHLRLDLEATGVWEAAATVRWHDSQFRSLSTPHLFLYLCAHGAKHMWAGMRWIADLSNLVQRLTPAEVERVVELSRLTHTRRILAMGLQAARGVPGTDVSLFPAHLMTWSKPPALFPSFSVDSNMAHLRYWASARERLRDRVASYATVFFVPTRKDGGRGAVRWIHRPLRIGLRAIRRGFA